MEKEVEKLPRNIEITSEGIKIKATDIIFEDGNNLEEKMQTIQKTFKLTSILIEQSKA